MWLRLLSLDYRRRRLLKRASPGALLDYLSTPFPARRMDCHDVEFVALDLETTGLDSRRDEILSVGMVCLKAGRIDLATARHHLVSPDGAIPERSAVIHQITDETAARGDALADVIPTVLSRLAGRVLLGHHVKVEREFLDAACRKLYGAGFLIPLVDTEALVRRWLERRDQPISSGGLRLHALRERYGLPRYKAHNALVDALATAELFCAFTAHANLTGKVPLKRFLEPQ